MIHCMPRRSMVFRATLRRQGPSVQIRCMVQTPQQYSNERRQWCDQLKGYRPAVCIFYEVVEFGAETDDHTAAYARAQNRQHYLVVRLTASWSSSQPTVPTMAGCGANVQTTAIITAAVEVVHSIGAAATAGTNTVSECRQCDVSQFRAKWVTRGSGSSSSSSKRSGTSRS